MREDLHRDGYHRLDVLRRPSSRPSSLLRLRRCLHPRRRRRCRHRLLRCRRRDRPRLLHPSRHQHCFRHYRRRLRRC